MRFTLCRCDPSSRLHRSIQSWCTAWKETRCLCLRGETLPLLRLDQLFPCPSCSLDTGGGRLRESGDRSHKVVILGVAEKRIALLVDCLLGQESTIVKPLGAYLHGCSSLAGATIGGDGRVRLVLDPAGLLENLQIAAMSATRKASA